MATINEETISALSPLSSPAAAEDAAFNDPETVENGQETDLNGAESEEDPEEDPAAVGTEQDANPRQSIQPDRASEGKIFIGGLPRETTEEEFKAHFGYYGDMTDTVIMKDKHTGFPRGFGFVTYKDAGVVDKVIEEAHVFHGKTVEIKRTIPRGATAASGSKEFRTKKLFVGGIPTAVTDDELKEFFEKFGEIREHMIMRDHSTSRSRGFGFVTFESEEAVDELLRKGNKIDFAGTKVEIKKAEPKKATRPLTPPHFRNSRPAARGGYRDSYGAGRDAYGTGRDAYGAGRDPYGTSRDAYGAGSIGVSPYAAGGGFGVYSGYVGSQYGDVYGAGYGPYRGQSALGYPGGLGGDYDVGGYGRAAGGYGYDAYYSDLGSGYANPSGGGGPSASRRGSGGNANGRFHPYSR